MEKNKSREQSTRSDVVRQLKAVRGARHEGSSRRGSACRAGRHEEIQYFQIGERKI